MNASMTAAVALEELAAVEAELPTASAALDDALTSGGDADAAEAHLNALFRRRDRCVRQADLLRKAEARNQKTDAALAMRQADEDVIRCQDEAAEAFEQFAPELRDRLAEIVALAGKRIGGAFEALDAAQAHSDALHDRGPTRINDGIAIVHALHREMVSVRAAVFLPAEQRKPFAGELDALLGVESFVRATAPVEH